MGNTIRRGDRDKDSLRGMKTSKAERPSVTVGFGNPTGGSNGDMRMSMTQGGPVLFCKFQDKWFSTGLKEVTGDVTREVKTHYMTGTKTVGTTAYIPINAAVVPRNSVVGVHLFMNHSGDYWHVYEWMSGDTDISDGYASVGDQGKTAHEVFYRANTHQIQIRHQGTQIDGQALYKLLIFYI